MKCSMCEKNARVLHRILQNLAKIGSDLYLEAMVSGLSLGTVSCLESSFAKIELAKNFFIEYHQQIRPPIPDGSSETKCRISLKSLLSVFRHLKQVEVCTLRLDQDSDRLVIKLKCAEEKVRMMYVPILEQDELDRDSSKDIFSNKLVCVTSVLSNVMTNFQSEMEVTMDISKEKIVVKNYIDDRIVEKTLLRTRVTMQAEEFQEYTVNQETRLTFCHRSFRAFLSLSEGFGANCSIKIDFDTEGTPVMFSVSEAPMEGKLLMMTLDREMYANQLAMTYDGSMHSDVHPHDSSVVKSQNKRQKPSPLVDDKEKESSPLNPKRPRAENSPPKSLTDSVIAAMDTLIDSRQDDIQATNSSTGNDTFLRSIPVDVQIHSNPPTSASIPAERNEGDCIASSSLNIVFQRESDEASNAPKKRNQTPAAALFAEEDEFDSVPASPPREEDLKRRNAKKIFRRCFEPTFRFSQIPKSKILAENSDSD